MTPFPHAACRRIDVALRLLLGSRGYHRRLRILAEVCDAAGCTLEDLDAWRSGVRVPTQGEAGRLAPALGVTFLWLRWGRRDLPIVCPRKRTA